MRNLMQFKVFAAPAEGFGDSILILKSGRVRKGLPGAWANPDEHPVIRAV